jgi:hypothetical protein
MPRGIILFFLLFTALLPAQEIDFKPKVDFFHLPNFELNTDEITDIQTDDEGYVWIISLSSIYKYNGSKFTKINTDDVNHGSFIWFQQAVDGRKYVIDYLSNIFFIENIHLKPFKHNKILRSKNLHAMIPSYQFGIKDELHIAQFPTWYYTMVNDSLIDMSENYQDFKGHAIRFIDNENPFIFRNSQASINGNERLIFLFDDNFNILDSIEIEHVGNTEHSSLTQKPNGNFLYSTGIGSIIEFSRKKIIREYRYPNKIIRLFVDKSGGLWISTKDDGIHFYPHCKIDSSQMIKYFENSMAFVSAQDYQGGIWLYSKEDGLVYISNPKFDYNSKGKYNINLNGDTLYYVTNQQIWKYLESSNSSNLVWDLSFKDEIISIFKDTFQNRLFVSSVKQAAYLKQKNIYPISINGFHNMKGAGMLNFSMLNPDNPQDILGITKYQHFVFNHNDSITNESPHYPSVISKFIRQGDSTWTICTNGIYISMNDSIIKYLGDDYPIAQNYASDITIFNNQIFFSFPNKGVYYFNNVKFKEVQYNSASLLNCKLAVEDDSTLWAISGDGCFLVTNSKEENTFKVAAYNALPRMAVNQFEHNQNYIYFTTNNGQLARSKFDDLRSDSLQTPKLLIKEIETQDSIFTDVGENELKLPYKKRSIQFNFEIIDFKNLNLNYRYRLVGSNIDDVWHSSRTNSVNYASLPAGEYTFNVQSKFGLGDWSESKSVSFIIATPYWQESWFIIGVILLTILIISQIIAYRYKVIFREQRLKLSRLQSEQSALRALMTPHYFFNFVSSLQYLIMEETREKANRFLALFASSMRNILHQSDAKYISIEKELKFIEEYLEMECFRMDGLFEYKVKQANDLILAESIPPFLLQPFVENAIEHGLKARNENGKLKVWFENEDSYLKVTIEDNGAGRSDQNENTKGKSFGISLIKKRLAIHNQSEKGVEIIDLLDEEQNPNGTKVVVYIKRVKTKK